MEVKCGAFWTLSTGKLSVTLIGQKLVGLSVILDMVVERKDPDGYQTLGVQSLTYDLTDSVIMGH